MPGVVDRLGAAIRVRGPERGEPSGGVTLGRGGGSVAASGRRTSQPASGQSEARAKAAGHDSSPTAAPKSGDAAATATNRIVFCRPRAVPTRVGATISAAAANETPLPAITTIPATISSGTASPSGAGSRAVAAARVRPPARAIARSGGCGFRAGRTRRRPRPGRRAADLDRGQRQRRGRHRPAALLVEVEGEEAEHRDLPEHDPSGPERQAPDPRVAQRPAEVTWGGGSSISPGWGSARRRPAAAADGPARQAPARARRAASTPPASAARGRSAAAIAPPSGVDMWRRPSASPRWERPNQDTTARPLAALALEPKARPARGRRRAPRRSRPARRARARRPPR